MPHAGLTATVSRRSAECQLFVRRLAIRLVRRNEIVATHRLAATQGPILGFFATARLAWQFTDGPGSDIVTYAGRATMTNATDALLLDLVEWVARTPRPYADMLDAWRTSCPRLPIWEDAVERGFVRRAPAGDGGVQVIATPTGRAFLHDHGRPRHDHQPSGKQADFTA